MKENKMYNIHIPNSQHKTVIIVNTKVINKVCFKSY